MSPVRGLRTATEDETEELAPAASGAPADFAGPVLPNPRGIRVLADTDSGIPVTRLPKNVTFQHQNFIGRPSMDISNPPRAQIIPDLAKELEREQ
jgi:hypothetical protein